MTEENNEADKLNHSIEHLENKLEELKGIKELVRILEKEDETTVTVDNLKDSNKITIKVNQGYLSEHMKTLAEIAEIISLHNNIIYDHRNDEYILKIKYRIYT